MVKLHRLNNAGIDRFQLFLDTQGTPEAESFDLQVILDRKYADPAGSGKDIEEECSFDSRFEAAQRLTTIIEDSSLENPGFDRGVWCWLSWLWFESLCRKDKNNRRVPKGSERWVLDIDYKRYYRHLLAGPWWIYNAHRDDPERARALLCTEVDKPGELVGQIAAYQELVSNPGLVEMTTILYYDREQNKLRRGHGGKVDGGARRLVKVLRQLDLIWDLYSTPAKEFLTLLPSEFDKFKQAAQKQRVMQTAGSPDS